jgi:hypothetical protein
MFLFRELIGAVKSKVSATIHSAVWYAVAGIFAIVAAGFFISALHVWLSIDYGHINASLMIGGAFLALALIGVLVAVIMRRSAARRLREQTTRLRLEPAAMATGLLANSIGSKQASVLILLALAAGWMLARPGARDRK